MRPMTRRFLSAAAALAFGATSACDQAATVEKQLPQGEDNFSCAALIYGTANYVENDEHKADIDVVKSNSLVAITHYATAYATPKGIDGQEAFAQVKLKGMKMSGRISGTGDELPTGELVQRAKACAEAI